MPDRAIRGISGGNRCSSFRTRENTLKLLLNSTRTMDATVPTPKGYRTTAPAFAARASELVAGLRSLPVARYRREMALSEKLTDAALADLHRWGEPGQPATAALFAFTGLVYKYVDAAALDAAALRAAGRDLLILSGLYGLLRPADRIGNYRLEMGARWAPGRAKNLVQWWRDELTAAVNRRLKKDEPILNLAAQEYTAALDEAALKGPLISPVFKERNADGSLKTVSVHAKMARGAMVNWCLRNEVTDPAGLLAFGELGWGPESEPPAAGTWLFTRPVRD